MFSLSPSKVQVRCDDGGGVQAGGKKYSPSQIGAFVLTKMKETAGESRRPAVRMRPSRRAVRICLPAPYPLLPLTKSGCAATAANALRKLVAPLAALV